MSENKWYAVYTRVRWEKKVCEHFEKLKIEHYCPMNKIQRQWADRKKTILEPLFTSYVFVRSNSSEFANLRKTDGVINLVHWLGKPAVVRDAEIETIKQFLTEHESIILEKTRVNVDDVVQIISGPLINHQGKVLAVKSKTVKIILPSLGFVMSAEIESNKIEIIKDNSKFAVFAQRFARNRIN